MDLRAPRGAMSCCAFAFSASAQTNTPSASVPHTGGSTAAPPFHKFKAVDADNHTILLTGPV